jgi:hypothetical protein
MSITNLLLLGLLAGSVLYMGSSKTVSSSIDNDIDIGGPAWKEDGSAGDWSLMLPPAVEGGRRKTKRKTRRHRK